jgi:(p)ppGpp synthase/HD superfamily hydrolase
MYSEIVTRALECAAVWHLGQVRKHPSEQIPYIVHPMEVGMLLLRSGAEDETIAAGILHDVVEDCGIRIDEVALATTPHIAELVRAVTEPPKSKRWDVRKRAYCERLQTAPAEALAVAAADHISNLRSILRMAGSVEDPWAIFHAPKDKKMIHERAVFGIIEKRYAGPLLDELRHSIELVERLPG